MFFKQHTDLKILNKWLTHEYLKRTQEENIKINYVNLKHIKLKLKTKTKKTQKLNA